MDPRKKSRTVDAVVDVIEQILQYLEENNKPCIFVNLPEAFDTINISISKKNFKNRTT